MNDGMLLQINRQRKLIPEDRLKAAQSIQETERAAGKTPRPLLDILATRGDLDSTTVRLIRTLMDNRATPPGAARPDNGNDQTVVDGFHAIVESVLMPAPEPKAGSSKAGWPKEVLDAEQDLKNLFGQFVLVAQVGSGGSGTVYRAWDRRVSRYSGLKILHTMEPSALERFTREARIAGNLQHPSIATIYEVGEQDGRYYIAMKYIDGRPIDADPRSIPECLALIRDACRALDYAHGQGIIHRDIKPANLLVDGTGRVYVTDFGIAKQSAHDHTSTLSITGTIIGTPKYLPPEQARGEAKRADARSDVYSIGATLYTLLAGRAPFPSSNVWETLESVMKHEPPALTSLNSAISPELGQVVAKAMAKDPAHRFPSAGALADELERLLVERRYTGRYGLLRYLARRWLFIALAGVLVGTAIHWKAELFFAKEKDPLPSDPESQYRVSAAKLLDLSADYAGYAPEDRDQQVTQYVVRPIQPLLNEQPNHLHGQVLLARADYVLGNLNAMRGRLDTLQSRDKGDYRIGFLRGLVELDDYLRKAPPLYRPEAPSPEWAGEIPTFPVIPNLPDGLATYFTLPSAPPPLLSYEWAQDRKVAQGLLHFVKGNWKEAASQLSTPSLPVIRRAWHRANYLARLWPATLEWSNPVKPELTPWHGTAKCRECLGAALALACEQNRPIPDFEVLRGQCAGDPAAELLILACIARRSVERGRDPGSAVAAGEKLSATGKDELRGVLRVANLRWKALSGSDPEDEYKKAFDELSATPATWMGRLARIEGLISLGARLKLRGGDFRPPLEEAVKLANALPNGDWKAPRVLRGEAYVRLGLPAQTLVELPDATGSAISDIRSNLVSAAAHLRKGEFNQARILAKRAHDAIPDHPEAMYLWGAALLELAKKDADPSEEAQEAVDHLSIALNQVPDYVEARFSRACALFLLADWATPSSVAATQCRLSAMADLDVVLKKFPTLAPAREVRGHLEKLLKRAEVPRGSQK